VRRSNGKWAWCAIDMCVTVMVPVIGVHADDL